jgi:hypothetical protein
LPLKIDADFLNDLPANVRIDKNPENWHKSKRGVSSTLLDDIHDNG